MTYFDPRKPKPWPVRLLNTLGVTDDVVATKIIAIGSILLLVVTVIFYFNIFNGQTAEVQEVDQEILKSMGPARP